MQCHRNLIMLEHLPHVQNISFILSVHTQLLTFADFEQDGEEKENDPDAANDPISQVDLQVHFLISAQFLYHPLMTVITSQFLSPTHFTSRLRIIC